MSANPPAHAGGQAGNGFLEFLAAESDRAYCTALRVTGNPALAEEVVQDAYVQVLRRPPRPQGREQMQAYFLKVVHGLAANAVRSTRRLKRREETYAVTGANNAAAPPDAAQSELAQAARAALERLTGTERIAVSLCCEQGLTRRSASDVLGIPERTVSKRVSQGLEKLRTLLVAQGFASVATVGIADSLGALGVIKAPAALTASLATLGSGAAKAGSLAGSSQVFKALVAKKAATGSGLGLKVAAVAVLAVAATGAYVALQPKPQPPARKAPPTAPVAEPAPKLARTDRTRVLWNEPFEDIASLSVTEWRPKGGLVFEHGRELFRSAPGALRLHYTFPRLPAAGKHDVWLANHRTLDRPIRIPPEATHLRMWIKVVSADPEAKFTVALFPADRHRGWSRELLLKDASRDWLLLEEDLRAMPLYWDNRTGALEGKDVPPLPKSEIAILELGVNLGDAELAIDDIELAQRDAGPGE